jgi:hypothetical protein
VGNDETQTALAAFEATVRAHIHPPTGLRFIESRYPYTYAADFLRAHVEMVPAWLQDRLDGSRGAASKVRSEWAERMGISDYAAAETLALAYIVENKVEDVPERITGVQRSADPHKGPAAR